MTLDPAVSALLQAAVFPPGILLAGLLAGAIAAGARRWRLAFALMAAPAAPAALTLVLAIPDVADRIARPLERRALSEATATDARGPLPRTAVVLGGIIAAPGIVPDDDGVHYDLAAAADRVVAGARLWKTGRVERIVFAGGSARGASEAELMARFAADLGAPRAAMLLESESRNTRQNAIRVAEVLRARNLGNDVALVTSAMHLPRALAEFRCAGLVPVGVPAEFESLGVVREFPWDWIPSLGAIDRSRRVLKEWAGLLAARCAA